MNKTINLFLASSSELKPDRERFEIFINRENKRLSPDGIFLHLQLWEDFTDAMSRTRLQDEYNKAVQESDIFVSLFFTKVGQFTAEEFRKAFWKLKNSDFDKPLIYTYFKNAPVNSHEIKKADIDSKHQFQEELKSLGHFPTVYENIDQLQNHFRQQLDKLLSGAII